MLALLILGPVVFFGLWRPLAQALDQSPDASLLAWCGVLVFGAALLRWLLRRLPPELDGLAARRPGAAVGMVLLGGLAIVASARIATFMGDAARTELSLLPDVPFFLHHSCLTAYAEGTRLAVEGVDNLYRIDRWPDLSGTPRSDLGSGTYSPFNLDAFAYPPTFLLLPWVLLSWMGDFASQRALWFTFNGLVLAVGLWTLARWLGGRVGLVALLLSVAIWLSPPILGTLQTGNVHLALMAAVMLSLVAFETRRPALGGALLAFAIVSKISPGILIVVLLLQRRFKEVLWTAGFSLGFVVLSVLAFGVAPMVDFLSYQLPRLSSGEALTFLAEADTIPINLSPFGLPFKLDFLGVDVGDPWAVARLINRVYTIVLLGLAVLVARRSAGPQATAERWLALLTLSALQSPLAPAYAAFPLFWLLSLWAAEVRGRAQAVGLALIWVFLTVQPPLDPKIVTAYTLVQQLLILGLAVFALLRSPRPAPGVVETSPPPLTSPPGAARFRVR